MVLELNIKNNKQTLEIVIENRINSISYLYLDTYENRNNYLSGNGSDHSYKLTYSDIPTDTNISKTKYTIDANLIERERFNGLFILTIFYNDGTIERKIVYDLNELYCVRMNFIRPMCETCCDNANQRMLVVLMFREMLLRNAIAFNQIDDALKYYTDIFRPFCHTDNPVSQCVTGSCSINQCKTC